MICAHCKARPVNIAHVKACAAHEQGIRSIGSAPVPTRGFTPPGKALGDLASQGEDIEGVYFKDGWYYKVVKGTNTGNWYAKVWESPLGDGEFEWSYQGRRPLYHLTEAHRVSAEQAAQFGALTGHCVFCSRKLTDDRTGASVERGYGPICAAKNGLPWGDEKELVSAESPFEEAPEWTI